MHILPYDVTVLIFSFIPRYDCIQCLFVCRSWKDAVPVYTERLWHRLSLQGSKDYSRELSFLHKCFGVHVKHVSIVSSRQDGRLDILLRMLLAKGCMNIKSLALERSYLPYDTTSFIDCLQRFRHLTRLLMNCLYLGGELPDFLSALVLKCPNLTHIILQDVTAHKLTFDPMTPLQQPHHRTPSSSSAVNVNTNLVFLHVSYRWRQCSFRHLIPILSRCPNLRYLSVAGEKDLDGAIFDYCPKLAYIDWMFFTTRHKLSWIHHHWNPDDRIIEWGLQDLSLFSYSNDIIDEIIRRQLTRHIRRMSLDDMENQNGTITRLLQHCPSLRTINLPSISSIQLLDMLARLTQLREINMRVVGQHAAKSSQLARFFSNTHSASCLHSVHLETDQPLSSDAIIAMVKHLPHLRIISLRPTELNEKELLVLLHMVPLLEKLRVENIKPSLSLSFFRQLITLPHLDSFHAAYTHLSSAGICLLANKMANTPFSLTLSPFTTDDPHCIKYTEQRLKKGRFRYYHQEHC
ncbi:predicted protein [Lichtheimia corymbifera JMRC:FSU:9682]|uniref:F-box domain-containing protein n=1 Tax=Lichtheimia corymbifera JMRC:FSU:9682 TaxID=1263082 RepID=A0A068S405_9FUNG|nr:predicted protein [Lichtheimia corymbifera JMRC:FSU:9682]